MTEKRYRKSYGNDLVIIDTFKKNSFSPQYEGVDSLCDLLNEQERIIQELKGLLYACETTIIGEYSTNSDDQYNLDKAYDGSIYDFLKYFESEEDD